MGTERTSSARDYTEHHPREGGGLCLEATMPAPSTTSAPAERGALEKYGAREGPREGEDRTTTKVASGGGGEQEREQEQEPSSSRRVTGAMDPNGHPRDGIQAKLGNEVDESSLRVCLVSKFQLRSPLYDVSTMSVLSLVLWLRYRTLAHLANLHLTASRCTTPVGEERDATPNTATTARPAIQPPPQKKTQQRTRKTDTRVLSQEGVPSVWLTSFFFPVRKVFLETINNNDTHEILRTSYIPSTGSPVPGSSPHPPLKNATARLLIVDGLMQCTFTSATAAWGKSGAWTTCTPHLRQKKCADTWREN